jgi:murein L,D-transpeptidase YcbB/YkuD
VIESGPSPLLDAVATASAQALAHDYAFGRVGDRQAMDWYIGGSKDAGTLARGLDQAIAAGKPRAFLESLLPTDARYVALREALSQTDDQASRDRLRANMERWRWMPRDLGQDYLYVNVPSYQLKVVNGGAAVSTYTVIVGAKDTPTPQLAGPASSLVVNPWWNVPQSIVKSSNLRPGRGGFVFKANADGSMSVRQPPGPKNSLGRIKINLINDQAIYLHDTPAKGAFTRDARALSHGCIRVKDIDQLAAELVDASADDGTLDSALARTQTATVQLGKTWQVYLVYFTADTDDAGQVVALSDPYGRDAGLIAKLDGGTVRMASR